MVSKKAVVQLLLFLLHALGGSGGVKVVMMMTYHTTLSKWLGWAYHYFTCQDIRWLQSNWLHALFFPFVHTIRSASQDFFQCHIYVLSFYFFFASPLLYVCYNVKENFNEQLAMFWTPLFFRPWTSLYSKYQQLHSENFFGFLFYLPSVSVLFAFCFWDWRLPTAKYPYDTLY